MLRSTQVFVGGTAGIGAALAVKTAKYSTNPNIHIVGRSKASAEKVLAQLKAANSDGHYEFHQYASYLQLPSSLPPTYQLNIVSNQV